MNTENSHGKISRYKLIVICLSILALLSGIWFAHGLYRAYRDGRLKPYHIRSEDYGPRNIAAGFIEPWMTFEFINSVFKLPPDYLRERLGIDDERYPHLTIGKFSERAKVGREALVDVIQDAIRDYNSDH